MEIFLAILKITVVYNIHYGGPGLYGAFSTGEPPKMFE